MSTNRTLTKAFRLILEREADPPAAPPVEGANPPTGAYKVAESLRDSNSAEQPDANAFRMMTEAAPPVVNSELESSLGASTGVSHGFESRSDSATLRPAAREQSDALVASRSRSFAEKKTTLRRPDGSIGSAKQAAPPVAYDDFDDDAATDELFRQIKEMTRKFQALEAPPVPADVAAFRLLLEQARIRLPPAPPVT